LRGHIPANHRPDEHAVASRVFLPRDSRWFIPAMVEGWQGSEYRTRTAFGHAVQVSTPHVHCCTFLFYWKGDLVSRFRRELYFWHHGAETPSYQCRLAATTPIPCGWASGTPNLRWFRTKPRVSVPITCFHVTTVHIERGIRVPVPSRAISSDNRVPSSCCRRHLL